MSVSNDELAALGAGTEAEQQRRLELRPIARDERGCRAQIADDERPVLERPAQHRDRVPDEAVEIERHRRAGADARERHELLDQLAVALGRVADQLAELARVALATDQLAELLACIHDRPEHVVELVPHAAEQLAERIEMAGAPHRLLEGPLVGDVRDHAGDPRRHAASPARG